MGISEIVLAPLGPAFDVIVAAIMAALALQGAATFASQPFGELRLPLNSPAE